MTFRLTLDVIRAMIIAMGTVAAKTNRPGHHPLSVAGLVETAISDGNGAHPLTPRGQSTALERLSVRGFGLFCESTMTLGEIARHLGCSKQYLYKLSKTQDWASRRAKLQVSVASSDDTRVIHATEIARAEIKSKVYQRIQELEELCQRKNLKAILAWLQMAGMSKPDVDDRTPRTVEVFNDLSDNRQVTVVEADVRPKPQLELDEEPPRLGDVSATPVGE